MRKFDQKWTEFDDINFFCRIFVGVKNDKVLFRKFGS